MKKLKMKIVKINTILLCSWLNQGHELYYRIIKGLPSDAEIINSRFGMDGQTIELVVYSKTYPTLKQGEIIPDADYIVAEDLRFKQEPEKKELVKN